MCSVKGTLGVAPLTGPNTCVLVLEDRGWLAGQYSQYHVQVWPCSQSAVACRSAEDGVTLVAPIVCALHALNKSAAAIAAGAHRTNLLPRPRRARQDESSPATARQDPS